MSAVQAASAGVLLLVIASQARALGAPRCATVAVRGGVEGRSSASTVLRSSSMHWDGPECSGVHRCNAACLSQMQPLWRLASMANMFMRQHSHSHAGGKCDHEAAGASLRRRSPSPAARYAPIPTAEELTAMAQSQLSKTAQGGQQQQDVRAAPQAVP